MGAVSITAGSTTAAGWSCSHAVRVSLTCEHGGRPPPVEVVCAPLDGGKVGSAYGVGGAACAGGGALASGGNTNTISAQYSPNVTAATRAAVAAKSNSQPKNRRTNPC